MSFLRRKTVSINFRECAARVYPGLKLNPVYWKLLQYLFFGGFRDEDTNLLIISQKILAKIAGKSVSRFDGEELLEAFQRDVMSPGTFSWSDWIPAKKCRQVTLLKWKPEMEAALISEWKKEFHSNGRVYFDDGRKFSKAKQKASSESVKKQAEERTFDCPQAKEAQVYLNSLPSNLFTKTFSKNYKAALEAAGKLDPVVRDIQYRILHSIQEEPKPIYGPTKELCTVRLFSVHESVLNLQRDVRKALCAGWSECDLANSQLAICAKLWNIPEIQAFLASKRKIWEYLCLQVGYPLEKLDDIKNEMKQPLYAGVYGMRKENVSKKFTKNLEPFGIDQAGEAIINSPLIKVLFSARERASKKIIADGGGMTCFGKWITFEPSTPRSAFKILAQQAQAVEFCLIYPVFELAKSTDQFKITLLQHDGLSIHFKRRPALWKERISSVVEEKTKLLGIETYLEWKDL